MPTLRTRAGKGSNLTPTEADTNFKRTLSAKTTTYSCLVSDNRSVIEGNSATPFTITLGVAATMAAAETGDYEVTIANIGTGAVTVARAGTDTINGAATSLTLLQYSSVTLKVNSAATGYNSIANGLGGLTSSVAELNAIDGYTGNVNDLNILSGASAGGLTAAELAYINTLTSNAQTQIDAKSPSASPTFTGTVVLPDTTSIGAVSSTELGYLDGVTSAIQTQLTLALTYNARANHTGTQLMSTISNAGALATLATVATAQIDAGAVTIPKAEAGFLQGTVNYGKQSQTTSSFSDYCSGGPGITDGSQNHLIYIPAGATTFAAKGYVHAQLGAAGNVYFRCTLNGVAGSEINVGDIGNTLTLSAESTVDVSALPGHYFATFQFRNQNNTLNSSMACGAWRIY